MRGQDIVDEHGQYVTDSSLMSLIFHVVRLYKSIIIRASLALEVLSRGSQRLNLRKLSALCSVIQTFTSHLEITTW